jgi:hypothetical protein
MSEPINSSSSDIASSLVVPPVGARDHFFQLLLDYKEIVGSIVLLATGILWAFAYFATRQQLKETRCLIRDNLIMIQGRMDSSNLSQIMVQNLEESAALRHKITLTTVEALKFSQFEAARNQVARKLADAEHSIAEALTRLTTGICLTD